VHFLYLDESGGIESPDSVRTATPAMVLLGVIVDSRAIHTLTRDFLSLKRRHFPHWFQRGPALDHIRTEVKGSDVLQMTRNSSRDRRRQAMLVRFGLLRLLERHDCRIVGRVWVKEHGRSLKRDATYCYAVQDIVAHLCHFLASSGSRGVVVADARTPNLDATVAHSIFTQKWRTGDDPYRPLLEVPLFANSQNHAGLQIADLLACTLVLPMAASAYGAPAGNVHSSAYYEAIRADHGRALRDLQYRYVDETGRWRGGLVVSDPAGLRPGSLLFGGGDRSTPMVGEPLAIPAPAYGCVAGLGS
jgi:Protein of unknown function (DUF3800)